MLTLYPYKDLVEIGHGGMATVYRATAPNGNLVALKVLAIHLASDTTARNRFEMEGNLRLKHPNIVNVLDWGVEDEVPFIVMDYIVGESLDRRLGREGTLSPNDLLPILKQVAEALNFAHAHGVIHRDVKPSNILIRTNGHALLGDFGVAKKVGWTAYTATTARVGSVFYMSPEQAGGVVELTPASDIYSLGIMVYYALAGRHPFEADNEIAIARMHMDAKPRHVSDVNPAVPRPVGSVVMQVLDKDPLKRPKTAVDFVDAFEKAISLSARRSASAMWFKPALIAATWLLAITLGMVGAVKLLPGQTSNGQLQSVNSASTITSTSTKQPTPVLTANSYFQVIENTETATVPETTPPADIAPMTTGTLAPRSSRATASLAPSNTPRSTRTPTRVPRATLTRTPRPTLTRTPRPTATRTPRPTATELAPTVTETAPSATPEITVTVIASATPTDVAVTTPTSYASTPTDVIHTPLPSTLTATTTPTPVPLP